MGLWIIDHHRKHYKYRGRANLVRVSYSDGEEPASKENLMRDLSELSLLTRRFVVLLFFGICSGGESSSRPCSSTCNNSSPGRPPSHVC